MEMNYQNYLSFEKTNADLRIGDLLLIVDPTKTEKIKEVKILKKTEKFIKLCFVDDNNFSDWFPKEKILVYEQL